MTTERDRDTDAQHRAIEHWMLELDADRSAGKPFHRGYLLVTFYRGVGVLCELRLDADGRVVPR